MRRILGVGLSLALLTFAGCGDDDSGTDCVDNDGDGYGANCTSGDDACDDDANNWTATGCADCVDGDGDGYGVDCDMGGDCDDTDATIYTGCGGCEDLDGDGHDAVDAVECPAGDDECDDDANNWTATGCADCVDADGDGYGVDCDMGTDCDDADDTVHTGCAGCVDADSDGHDAYDATTCPTGDDECDGDANNWTATGCADCVDGDGDGYGVDCDMGDDCDDADAGIHTGCVACVDGDNDGHDGFDATTCPTGDDQCDTDPNNWTTTGCTSCVDADGDGYGVDCDMGADCDDNNINVHANCQVAAFYRGDFLTNNTDDVMMVTFPGPTYTLLPLTDLDHTGSFDDIALSPDGSHIAVSGENMAGDNVILLYTADGMGTPVTLATYALGWNADMDHLAFSPDGAWLAFKGDIELSGGDGVYVVPTDGSAPPKLVTQVPISGDYDVTNFAWSPDTSTSSRYLSFRGDMVTENTFGLWTVEITAATPAPVLIEAAEVQSLLAYDNQGRVYYRVIVAGVYQLWRSDAAATTVEQVPGTQLTNAAGDASIGAIGMSPSGTKIAFSADSPTADLYEVYTLDLAGSTSVQVSSTAAIAPSTGISGPSAFGYISWSPDETMLAVVSDWQLAAGDADNDYSAYILPAVAPAGGVRIFQPLPAGTNRDVNSIDFTADSARVVVRGDLVDNNDTEVYSTTDFTTALQDPATLLVQDVVVGGDIDEIVIP